MNEVVATGSASTAFYETDLPLRYAGVERQLELTLSPDPAPGAQL